MRRFILLASILFASTLFASILLPAGLAGQTGAAAPRAPYVIPRLSSPIVFDGRVDEPAWEAIDPLTVTEHVPDFRGEPTERTEFRVAYDDRYVYFSCRAYDSDPSGIRAPSLQRDVSSFSNDWCVIDLDPFNDNETALVFGTNPAGVRSDAVFPKDGTAPANFSWNTFWDAAVSRDRRGWYAEIRIPLSSLRFQPEPGGRVVMGMAVWRNIARKNEIHTWPAISPRWGVPISFLKASQFRDVSFRGIEPRTPLYITPYALAGTSRTNGLNDAGTGYVATRERVGDVGVDAKYGIASNLTLDLTVNTDFAQVEADDQQVNLTRFSLFFPEKRQFFQERADIFDVSLGGVDRVFHSRRIGIVDGEQVPIRAGARLVGRVGQWDVGVIDMQTGATALAPGENMGVLRLRRRVLNANSYVGGILTSRVAEAGQGANVVAGADAVIRVVGQDYLTLDVVGSRTDTLAVGDTAPDALDRSLLRAAWQRRGVDGFTYGLDVVRAGAAFEPDLGFLRRRDYTSAGAQLGYGWRPGDASPVLVHGPSIDASVFARNADGTLETLAVEPEWGLTLKSGHEFTLGGSITREDLDAGFELPDDASVPAGEYTFGGVQLSYTPPSGTLLRAGASVSAGGFYDGSRVGVRVSPTWNVSRHLELGGSYSVDAVSFPDRDQRFTAHVARLRARVMVSTAVSAFAFLQYTSTADRLAANIRFRYNPSEGHDLYVVWNEGLVTNRTLLDPVPPLSEGRTLIIKYARTFTFGL